MAITHLLMKAFFKKKNMEISNNLVAYAERNKDGQLILTGSSIPMGYVSLLPNLRIVQVNEIYLESPQGPKKKGPLRHNGRNPQWLDLVQDSEGHGSCYLFTQELDNGELRSHIILIGEGTHSPFIILGLIRIIGEIIKIGTYPLTPEEKKEADTVYFPYNLIKRLFNHPDIKQIHNEARERISN